MPVPSNPDYVAAKDRKLIDLTGQRFGRLTVISRVPQKIPAYWNCVCDCGGQKTTVGTSLRRGHTTSCGCVSRTHGGFGTRLYRIWANMLNRCRNPKVPAYKNYGGRGVSVCDLWTEFPEFKAWAESNGYADDLSIEREDVNGNYTPSNCIWIPIRFQSANRRTVRRDPSGRAWCDIAREHGIPAKLYSSRLAKGWSDLDAATRPRPL